MPCHPVSAILLLDFFFSVVSAVDEFQYSDRTDSGCNGKYFLWKRTEDAFLFCGFFQRLLEETGHPSIFLPRICVADRALRFSFLGTLHSFCGRRISAVL